MPHKPMLTCAMCARPMWTGPGSLPQGQALCRRCRALSPNKGKRVCPDCAGPKSPTSEVCRTCRAKRQRIRPDDDRRVQYNDRARNAPGLRSREREQLLAKWRRRGVLCSFCDGLADTIDHAIPLVRGGTNYEGNLIPACRRCNSAKQARLIIEWRAQRKASRTISPTRSRNTRNTRTIVAIHGVQVALNICPECGSLCFNKYCDATCSTRYTARTAYRLRVGIPVGAPVKGVPRPRIAL